VSRGKNVALARTVTVVYAKVGQVGAAVCACAAVRWCSGKRRMRSSVWVQTPRTNDAYNAAATNNRHVNRDRSTAVVGQPSPNVASMITHQISEEPACQQSRHIWRIYDRRFTANINPPMIPLRGSKKTAYARGIQEVTLPSRRHRTYVRRRTEAPRPR